MKNSASNESFNYIESEDEDEEKWNRDGDDSDSSHSSMAMRQESKPNSYSNAWPQSYRQSIDLYSSVPSPNVGFLGNSSLSRFGSSFLSSSLTQRHTAEITKPLLPTAPTDVEQQQQRRSSYTLLPPVPARRSSILKKGDSEHKPSRISHEFPISQGSTFGQALLNGINVLCGVGILSAPYAVKEGGWLSLAILLMFAVLSFYTGLLLRYCLDSAPGLETYPDIGQAAFGKLGRIAISIILYVELYACCVEYIILESDNLSSLFPNAHLTLLGYELGSHHLFALAATLAVLPTCWLRDLSILSYISVGGVIASILVVLCLFWVGLVDQVGFVGKGTTLNLSTLPVAIGLYGYCYSGHAVYPNIYTSMANRSQYPAVLLTSFAICTFMCAGAAVLGYLMFGESTQSQFTLNMPQNLIASKLAVWTTVVNPFTKYALTISPVAMSLEELIPTRHLKSHMYPILIRTALVISTLFVGLSIPFFGLVMALIGSLLTMLVTLILPCACYLSILREKVTYLQVSACVLTITVGVISSAFGTYSAVSQIIENLM
ncbi:amino acid transporter AVT1C isoform X1 [Beta vulgaris subsp. vulgaris]|uniref:amino acid transporter AVT1C isoform X1 n=1 Tax=Beta vulgaris subsp. vulgaris TaxID=3555 RepID=UPI0020374CB6|nr:amino acid transporter AVT1C isoform X1 [Beta vulgaris subsp. vulgaris]XP_057252117.1 amino acid transporter AVT1C isoform X1 [Beta vulgaris subsp. vulgaris]